MYWKIVKNNLGYKMEVAVFEIHKKTNLKFVYKNFKFVYKICLLM